MEACILWANEINMVVVCPYCSGAEYQKNVEGLMTSVCRQGTYEAKGIFDLKTAVFAMKRRQKDIDYKSKKRNELKMIK